ncbi:MAG TPA: VCBS repeat-containing protein [Jatrophihabitans sp.]|nr:VCBS repeat-containing protein [Jatrophihabitans sp.]
MTIPRLARRRRGGALFAAVASFAALIPALTLGASPASATTPCRTAGHAYLTQPGKAYQSGFEGDQRYGVQTLTFQRGTQQFRYGANGISFISYVQFRIFDTANPSRNAGDEIAGVYNLQPGRNCVVNEVGPYTFDAAPGLYEVRATYLAGNSGRAVDEPVVRFRILPPSGESPAVSDFDGDSRTDLAVYRPGNATWYINGVGAFNYGDTGDIPVPGDYNGDRRTDIANFRPSNGTWYIGGNPVQYGAPGDIPVPGDYNGDGITDVAVYRPSNGTWYVYNVGVFQWGVPGDVPVPGDYNGDGRTDTAIWRPNDGTWWVRDYGVFQWGAPGDIPTNRWPLG